VFADDRKLGIQDKRHHGGQISDALTNNRQDRDQQPEQRYRRNSHDHRRGIEHAIGGSTILRYQDTDRHSGHNRNGNRDSDQRQMFNPTVDDLRPVADDELQRFQRCRLLMLQCPPMS
jgi:hypothetical protein